MSPSAKPAIKPASPHFSCGPTKKRPGWSASNFDISVLGRSHRAKHPKAKIQSVLTKMRSLLGLPSDYHIAIVPGSNTGAVEMALWSLLGARGVDVLAWLGLRGWGWRKNLSLQLISSHLIPSHLISSHLISAHHRDSSLLISSHLMRCSQLTARLDTVQDTYERASYRAFTRNDS